SKALELLDRGADDENRDATSIRFALGALARKRDPRGLERLEADRDLFDNEPKTVADYLIALAGNPTARRRIDPEWLLDIATDTVETTTLATQLHACRALSHLRVSKKHGERLHDLARSPAHQSHVPL